jgi:hypothetical protein
VILQLCEMTYLSELPPVEEMAGIVFEDENVIDLGLVPDATCQAEEEEKKVGQKVAGIYL